MAAAIAPPDRRKKVLVGPCVLSLVVLLRTAAHRYDRRETDERGEAERCGRRFAGGGAAAAVAGVGIAVVARRVGRVQVGRLAGDDRVLRQRLLVHLPR